VLYATIYALVESWARRKDGRAQRAAHGKGKSGALEGKSWPPVTPRLHSPVSTHDRIPCSRLPAAAPCSPPRALLAARPARPGMFSQPSPLIWRPCLLSPMVLSFSQVPSSLLICSADFKLLSILIAAQSICHFIDPYKEKE